MVGQIAAQVALLAFAAAIVAGLHAGNSATTVLLRALLTLAAALLLGSAAAWTVKLVLRDHVQRAKREIDQEHVRASSAPDATAESTPQAGAGM
jgi:hypothetical protein